MLHCFQCGADLPDNLVFCLQCGARLEIDDDTTVVDPPIVIPIDPTPSPVVDPLPRPVDPRPGVSRQGSGVLKFILGGLIGAGVVIVFLVVLGIVIYTVQGEQGTGNASPNASPANSPAPTQSPSPSPTATKKPSPTPDPANGGTETTAVTKVCDVVNPAGGTVNLRRYCDTRDCSQDSSTLYIQAEQGDVVERTSRKPVTSGRFTWVQVKYGGELLWISSNRINCD